MMVRLKNEEKTLTFEIPDLSDDDDDDEDPEEDEDEGKIRFNSSARL